MSTLAWLTPDSAPSGEPTICRLFVPNAPEWRAQIRGLFSLLVDPDNYELFGELTPQETADVWLTLFENNLLLEECNEGASMAVPVGTILPYAGADVPTGYVLCNGEELSEASWPELFAVIGHTFGTPSIAGNFVLPSLSGKFPLGAGIAPFEPERVRGEVGGASTVALVTSELPEHEHQQAVQTNFQQDRRPANLRVGTGSITDYFVTGTGFSTPAASLNPHNTYPAGEGEAHENMPPFLVLQYIIKAG